MKEIYIKDLHEMLKESRIEIKGWIKNRRKSKGIVFLDICDCSGDMQVVVSNDNVTDEIFDTSKKIALESAVSISGVIKNNDTGKEIEVEDMSVIGLATQEFSPRPRSKIDIFDPGLTDHMLRNRHMYIRNPKIMSILNFRSILMNYARRWFNDNKFIEIDAPILTPVPLYDDGSAMSITVHKEDVFLTQCVGYYLEAAVHAFERVYNMGPSFRGEESRSKRHLMEYWHIKAELAFGNLEDIISIVENIIKYLTEMCHKDSGDLLKILGTNMCLDGIQTPFERISYRDAIKHLQKKGFKIEFGKGLGSSEEVELSKTFKGPFWITGIPRVVEPFPYVVDPNDNEVTMTADLIASNGYGELLGVAEKIYTLDMLDERLEEKGKLNDERYEWIREVHQVGCVPHIAFGMGLERLVRWLLNIPHVRDTIPFPRIFRRNIKP